MEGPTYAPREEAEGVGRRKAEVQAMATNSRVTTRLDDVLRDDDGMVRLAGCWVEKEG